MSPISTAIENVMYEVTSLGDEDTLVVSDKTFETSCSLLDSNSRVLILLMKLVAAIRIFHYDIPSCVEEMRPWLEAVNPTLFKEIERRGLVMKNRDDANVHWALDVTGLGNSF